MFLCSQGGIIGGERALFLPMWWYKMFTRSVAHRTHKPLRELICAAHPVTLQLSATRQWGALAVCAVRAALFSILPWTCLVNTTENPCRVNNLMWFPGGPYRRLHGKYYFGFHVSQINNYECPKQQQKILLASFRNGCEVYTLVYSKSHFQKILPSPKSPLSDNRSCFKDTCSFMVVDRLIQWSHFNKHHIRISHLLLCQCKISSLEGAFNILTILIHLINISNSHDKAYEEKTSKFMWLVFCLTVF